MGNERLIRLLDELRSHLDMAQGNDLKSMLDQSKMDPSGVGVENPEEEAMETDENKPKGIALEKVSISGKPDMMDPEDKMPGDDEEMSEEELEELLKKLT